VVITSEEAVLAGVLRTWDDDLIKHLFHNTQTSAFGEVGIIGRGQGTGVNRAGFDMVSKGLVLLFSPVAVDEHRCILIYNAVPSVQDSMALGLSIREEFGVPFFFIACPDKQGRDYAIDLRANLTL
jgi:hypothetical protein